MSSRRDTIAAVATPRGVGGLAVLRISGPRALALAEALGGRVPAPRRASFRRFCDAAGEVIDEGIVIHFAAPASYTGEDVVELQCHGGPVVCDMLMERILALGARPAEPGEFSLRAFLNDRLDLVQAEAIADLIDSRSRRAARAAQRSLQGEFSRRVEAIVAAVTDLRAYVEAALDFPDEEVDFLADEQLRKRAQAVLQRIEALQKSAEQGRLLREGLTLVLAGEPNAGKSSLLNRLAGYEAAIVTDVPGTTRDVLREEITLDGLPVHVVDTAGLRQSSDAIEAEGVRRARGELARADYGLIIVDAADGPGAALARLGLELPRELDCAVVLNKIDRLPDVETVRRSLSSQRPVIPVSALTGDGLDALVAHLEDVAGLKKDAEDVLTARRRHLEALRRAAGAVRAGLEVLIAEQAGELFAEELRLAQQQLGEITGTFTTEDLLGRIFSSFCIGK